MPRSSVLSSLSAIVLVFGLAACSADAITNALQDQVTAAQEQADIGTVAGGAAMQNLDLMYDGADGGMASMQPSSTTGLRFDVRGSGPVASVTPNASSCTYDAQTGRRNCDPVDFENGLVLTTSYELFSGNQPQQTFSTTATDSINMDAVLQGTVTNTNATATIDRHLNLTVAKDPDWSTQRIWHGQGTDNSSATVTGDNNTTRSYTLNTTTDFTDIVVPQPRTFPTSGTIQATIQGTRTREGDRTVSTNVSYVVRVTFNGTHIVPLDIGPDANNFTGHFCVDLTTRTLASTGCQTQ